MPIDDDELGDEWFGPPKASDARADVEEWRGRLWAMMLALIKDEPSFFEQPPFKIVEQIGDHLGRLEYITPPPDVAAKAELKRLVELFIENEVSEKAALDEPPKEEFSPSAPDLIADAWVRLIATSPQGITVRRWDGAWWTWLGIHSVRCSEEDRRAPVGRFLMTGIKLVVLKNEERIVKHPTKGLLDNVMDALRSKLTLPSSVVPPVWISDGGPVPFDVKTTVSVENGLLTLSSGKLHPASPQFFCLSSLRTRYDPHARCPNWGAFLSEIWDDRQSSETLQEMFGYLLTSDTRQQKAFMIVGPPRSGKGTIGRVLAALLGPDAVSRPALADFGEPYGMEPLIGKSLAIISDARLDGNVPSGVLAERLLAISGEDTINIGRKYKEAWSGPLSVRFLLLTNELPRFRDASGALPNRFIMLRMNRTWLGKEDPELFDRLLPELSGILNWAIEGWTRLQERGHFVQPDAAREIAEQLAMMANPIAFFVEEACEVGPGENTSIGELYRHYVDWSKKGEMKPASITLFSRDLRSSIADLEFYRPHGEARRIRGIGIKFWNNNGSDGSSGSEPQGQF